MIAKFETLPMVDVHLPATDGREPSLSRCTQPEAEHRFLLDPLRRHLPGQPPPKITAARAKQAIPELALGWRPAGLEPFKSTTLRWCRRQTEKDGLGRTCLPGILAEVAEGSGRSAGDL